MRRQIIAAAVVSLACAAVAQATGLPPDKQRQVARDTAPVARPGKPAANPGRSTGRVTNLPVDRLRKALERASRPM